MGITVSGVGDAIGAPDTVEVDVGVSVLADTVAEATAVAAERSQAVISALSTGGVAEDDMTTIDLTIQPEYDYSGNQQRLTGYRVSNTVRAKVRDINGTGAIVDSVSAAGGDHSRINGLRFSIEDDAKLERAAREAAWSDAAARALQLAELSGQRLGPATSITETIRNPVVPVRMMADMAMAKEASTPIQPGTSTVTVNLQVEFAFGD
ncbi:MAG: SIMPL domain-containing protein [Actinomycetota bacterium]|nr:SIMPL domain-containing protein [Actinomycetota bacterium]